MSRQHVYVLRVPVPLPLCGGILASDMAYGVVRQGFDPGLQGSALQLRLGPALVYKAGCTCVILYRSQMGKRWLQRRATCVGGMVIVSECLS
jgi:hypothetical protein